MHRRAHGVAAVKNKNVAQARFRNKGEELASDQIAQARFRNKGEELASDQIAQSLHEAQGARTDPEQHSSVETCKYWCVWACYVSKDVILISLAVSIGLGMFIAWPAIMIHKGLGYECSTYPFIPIYLVIMGVSAVGGIFGPLFGWMVSSDREDKWYFGVTAAVMGISCLVFMGCWFLSNVVLTKLPAPYENQCDEAIWKFAKINAIVWDVLPLGGGIIFGLYKLTSCGGGMSDC